MFQWKENFQWIFSDLGSSDKVGVNESGFLKDSHIKVWQKRFCKMLQMRRIRNFRMKYQ